MTGQIPARCRSATSLGPVCDQDSVMEFGLNYVHYVAPLSSSPANSSVLDLFFKVTVYATRLCRSVWLDSATTQNLLDTSHMAVISRCFKPHMVSQCVISWPTKVVAVFLQNMTRLYRVFIHSLVTTHCKRFYESINTCKSYISGVTECRISLCISIQQVGRSLVACGLSSLKNKPLINVLQRKNYVLAISWSAVQYSVCTLQCVH